MNRTIDQLKANAEPLRAIKAELQELGLKSPTALTVFDALAAMNEIVEKIECGKHLPANHAGIMIKAKNRLLEHMPSLVNATIESKQKDVERIVRGFNTFIRPTLDLAGFKDDIWEYQEKIPREEILPGESHEIVAGKIKGSTPA